MTRVWFPVLTESGCKVGWLFFGGYSQASWFSEDGATWGGPASNPAGMLPLQDVFAQL